MSSRGFAFSIFILIGGMLLTGCVTARYKEFEKVRLGMGKNEVIEAAGGPNITKRWQGKDRWIYDFPYHPNGPTTREVHFEDGHVTYVGQKIAPAVTPTEQDRRNEESNKAENKRLAEEKAYYELQTGAVRASMDSNSRDQHHISNEEFYNGAINLEKEKRKRAPEFIPVE